MQQHKDSVRRAEAVQMAGELGHQLDWNATQQADTIDAYLAFLKKYPQSEHRAGAERRLGELEEERDWQIALETNSIEAYRAFEEKYPNSKFVEHSRRRRLALEEDRDWARARRTNTVETYWEFIEKYSQSRHVTEARHRIVDLRGDAIFTGDHGTLPQPTKLRAQDDRNFSQVNVYNDTPYTLRVIYSGPESFEVSFDSQEKSSFELCRGSYRVAATVTIAHVRDYAGQVSYDGSDYQSNFYITTTPERRGHP